MNAPSRLVNWISRTLNQSDIAITPMAGDASFRRFYRVTVGVIHLIAMHSPPEKDDSLDSFLNIAKAWGSAGALRVPNVVAADCQQGFVLMTDLGEDTLSQRLDSHSVDDWYDQALRLLQGVHTAPMPAGNLPHFDAAFMQQELALFTEWFLGRWLGFSLDEPIVQQTQSFFDQIIEACLEQPQVVIHRDYHSRNLVVSASGELGIVDFQDAMIGPLPYDVVSLLRDAYVDWPLERVDAWARHHFANVSQKINLPSQYSEADFMQGFHMVSLQRLMKVTGIFARLALRDQKPGYLPDIPRVLNYLLCAAQALPMMAELIPIYEQALSATLSKLAEPVGVAS